MTLKQADLKRGLAAFKQNAKMAGQPSVEVVPLFEANDDVVVEWRACTVGLIDDLLKEVNKLLGFELTLPQLLESTFRVSRSQPQSVSEDMLTRACRPVEK